MRIASKRPSEPARVAPLSVLPVFFDLNGKRAVVAGGSAAAAWKAELLAAAGAEVHVFARDSELTGEFRQLLSRGAGSFVLHGETWSEAVLGGAAIAVADAEDDEEAAAFAEAARRAGVPCNVIDRPDFCAFQFGSIVNRSPVVVGISSAGAAPILAQAIRRRVEALLPHTLAEWAALARRVRPAVTARLKPGGERRAFWEAFVDRAFGAAPARDEEARIMRDASRLAAATAGGRVTLVAAGTGDADMLTLKAVRALQAADVIFFEAGVSGEVLELARREAQRLPAGRDRPAAIHRMAALAVSGKRVVHLQRGDVTGRGIEALEAAGVTVEPIPGVAVQLPHGRDGRRGDARACRRQIGRRPSDALAGGGAAAECVKPRRVGRRRE
jgi:uroporphyrin-III C-methyltransferase/precorrin-2 dehydrogenase/sirohydrochlorin ferrochelatase